MIRILGNSFYWHKVCLFRLRTPEYLFWHETCCILTTAMLAWPERGWNTITTRLWLKTRGFHLLGRIWGLFYRGINYFQEIGQNADIVIAMPYKHGIVWVLVCSLTIQTGLNGWPDSTPDPRNVANTFGAFIMATKKNSNVAASTSKARNSKANSKPGKPGKADSKPTASPAKPEKPAVDPVDVAAKRFLAHRKIMVQGVAIQSAMNESKKPMTLEQIAKKCEVTVERVQHHIDNFVNRNPEKPRATVGKNGIVTLLAGPIKQRRDADSFAPRDEKVAARVAELLAAE